MEPSYIIIFLCFLVVAVFITVFVVYYLKYNDLEKTIDSEYISNHIVESEYYPKNTDHCTISSQSCSDPCPACPTQICPSCPATQDLKLKSGVTLRQPCIQRKFLYVYTDGGSLGNIGILADNGLTIIWYSSIVDLVNGANSIGSYGRDSIQNNSDIIIGNNWKHTDLGWDITITLVSDKKYNMSLNNGAVSLDVFVQ